MCSTFFNLIIVLQDRKYNTEEGNYIGKNYFYF